MTNTALNRTVVIQLSNNSGMDVAQGDVVVLDVAAENSFTVTTLSGYSTTPVGVVLEPLGITITGVGGVAFGGWVPVINLSSAASIGDAISTTTTAKKGVPSSAAPFAYALENGTSPAAIIIG